MEHDQQRHCGFGTGVVAGRHVKFVCERFRRACDLSGQEFARRRPGGSDVAFRLKRHSEGAFLVDWRCCRWIACSGQPSPGQGIVDDAGDLSASLRVSVQTRRGERIVNDRGDVCGREFLSARRRLRMPPSK
jgi:hypothetical protein